MYDIIIGRSKKDRDLFGAKGTILLAKHYVKMGQVTSLSTPILMDVTRSHVVFVCGKRGAGKSYTLGIIAEGIVSLPVEIRQNLSVLIFDTMGIYWTMKYPNHKDEMLLKQWDLHGKEINVRIFTPFGYFKENKDKGIPTDFPFSIRPHELDAVDWCLTFGIVLNSQEGVLIERIVNLLKDKEYSIDDIIGTIKEQIDFSQDSKNIVINHFINTNSWGVFSEKGTEIKDLATAGTVSVLDLSCYSVLPDGWLIKALVIGIVSKKLFIERMVARKNEEFSIIKEATHYLTEESDEKKKVPQTWLVVDEAHEFLPHNEKTAATDALVTILREGREPGISLVLASQQPGKINTDVMTQSDIIISHRITAKVDTDALGKLTQSYMRQALDQELNELPRTKGAALIMDDENEKIYPVQVRPRFTWHGGEAPTAIKKEKKLFE